jgi:hyperpolarization activated cyclic nucleotide-gated potassium channel 2
LLACIPFGLFTPKGNAATANSSKLIRLSRLPRLYRLIRIIRMLKMIKILKNSEMINNITEKLGNTTAGLRLLQIVGLTFYFVHLMACLWYGWCNFIGYPYNCWVKAQ